MKVLVTGGGGFLGSAIVRRLLERGDEVTIAARSDYPGIVALGAVQVRGDLADMAVAEAAVRGQDAVIHTAAKAGIWGDYAEYFRSNVVATQNILDACGAAGVRTLVYTSTPSVTFDGADHVNAGPDLPYAPTFRTHYAATKCEAERAVLAAGHVDAVVLRPHLIWGPGDPFIFPGVIERHMQGKLARVGDGTNQVDITYVDNGAAAHLAALDALSGGAPVAGKAFFISDGEPITLWPFLDELFATLDLPPLRKHVPAGLAFAVGGMLESTYKLLGRREEPRMTRFAAQQVTTTHTYDMTPAREQLGYEPVISRADAWRLTIADLRRRGLCGTG